MLHVAFGTFNGPRGQTLANPVKFASGLGLGALLLTAACATSPSGVPEDTAERRARLAAVSLLPDCADAARVTGALTSASLTAG